MILCTSDANDKQLNGALVNGYAGSRLNGAHWNINTDWLYGFFASDVMMKWLSVPTEEIVTCEEDFQRLFLRRKLKVTLLEYF